MKKKYVFIMYNKNIKYLNNVSITCFFFLNYVLLRRDKLLPNQHSEVKFNKKKCFKKYWIEANFVELIFMIV